MGTDSRGLTTGGVTTGKGTVVVVLSGNGTAVVVLSGSGNIVVGLSGSSVGTVSFGLPAISAGWSSGSWLS